MPPLTTPTRTRTRLHTRTCTQLHATEQYTRHRTASRPGLVITLTLRFTSPISQGPAGTAVI